MRILTILLLASTLALAQTPELHPDAPDAAKPPIVTFDFVLSGSNPGHYSLAVDSTGRAAYLSEDVPTPGAKPDQPYSVHYLISEPTRARIFQLADQLHHFQGDFEFHGGRVANMGAKTFTWIDGKKEIKTSFNYSANPRLEELTRMFQEIGATIEHGRRLQYLLRFDKLGLDAELKRLEEDTTRNQLGELQLLQPLLQQLAGDSALMNITRQRAHKLLRDIQSNAALRRVTPN